MKIGNEWLNDDAFDKAERRFVDGVMDRADAEIEMTNLIAEAAHDAGFEAGVLAAEAGLGRADA